jgi:hypothetical protein
VKRWALGRLASSPLINQSLPYAVIGRAFRRFGMSRLGDPLSDLPYATMCDSPLLGRHIEQYHSTMIVQSGYPPSSQDGFFPEVDGPLQTVFARVLIHRRGSALSTPGKSTHLLPGLGRLRGSVPDVIGIAWALPLIRRARSKMRPSH